MSISDDKKADLKVKSLEMIQAVTTRMAGYSASLKNYCITVTIALAGYSISVKTPSLLILAFLPILVFSLLDSYYLGVERQFRRLYDIRRREDWNEIPTFEMSLSGVDKDQIVNLLLSRSIAWFYGPLILSVLVVILFVEA